MAKVRPLPADLQEVAIYELNEVPERIPKDLEALRTWINQQPYLKARTNDQFLLAFLRGCKFSLEKAKSKVDKYYTMRTKYPDFYTIQNPDDSGVLELIRCGVAIPLPTPLHGNGPRIILIRPGAYSTNKFTMNEVMSVVNGLAEITMLHDDYCNVNGFIDILDISEITPAHGFQATPTVIKKISTYGEAALPLRQKAIHIIHTPSFFEPIFNLIKSIITVKQQERLHFHFSNMEKFYQHIPQKYLPKEYGGENGSIPEIIAATERTFLEYHDYLLEGFKYGVNEKLRPEKGVEDDNVFGVDGSFRKINVD